MQRSVSSRRPRSSRKPSSASQHVAAHRHVRADQVAHGRRLGRQAAVAAADGPQELVGEPARPCRAPVGADAAADAEHIGARVGREQLLEPVRLGLRVVVEEGDDRAGARERAAVAGAGQTCELAVGDDDGALERELGALEEAGRCGRPRRSPRAASPSGAAPSRPRARGRPSAPPCRRRSPPRRSAAWTLRRRAWRVRDPPACRRRAPGAGRTWTASRSPRAIASGKTSWPKSSATPAGSASSRRGSMT